MTGCIGAGQCTNSNDLVVCLLVALKIENELEHFLRTDPLDLDRRFCCEHDLSLCL